MQRIVRLAAASPALRAFLVGLLNRMPALKRRLKRWLARASTVAAQRAGRVALADEDDAILSEHARRALQDLRTELEHRNAERERAPSRD